MTVLTVVLAASAGAIAGLLGYGLAPSHNILWAAGAAAVAICGVVAVTALITREEDRDPTIRPPNLPYDDRR
jgi:hypothetical protein